MKQQLMCNDAKTIATALCFLMSQRTNFASSLTLFLREGTEAADYFHSEIKINASIKIIFF